MSLHTYLRISLRMQMRRRIYYDKLTLFQLHKVLFRMVFIVRMVLRMVMVLPKIFRTVFPMTVRMVLPGPGRKCLSIGDCVYVRRVMLDLQKKFMEIICISHPLSLVALPPLVAISPSQCCLRELRRNQSRQGPKHHYK